MLVLKNRFTTITNFILTAENIDDRNTIFDLISEKNSIKIIGNKGYINNQLKSALAKEREVLLISLKRKNCKSQLEKQLRNVLSKTRRRVKTRFLQPSEQLNINKVLSKSKWGLLNRIAIKILVHNLLFVINIIIRSIINTNNLCLVKNFFIIL